jgi:hypothetical protein
VIYRKRFSNDLPTILEPLAPYHTEMKGLVVESTYNWYWLVDGLMELGRVGVRHPSHPSMTPGGCRSPHQKSTSPVCSQYGFSELFAGCWRSMWAH